MEKLILQSELPSIRIPQLIADESTKEVIDGELDENKKLYPELRIFENSTMKHIKTILADFMEQIIAASKNCPRETKF